MSGIPSTGKLWVRFSPMRWPGSWWPDSSLWLLVHYGEILLTQLFNTLYFSQWQHKTVDSTAPKAASVKFEELSEQTCRINVDLSSNPGKHTEVVEAVFLHLWLNKYFFSVNLSSKIEPPHPFHQFSAQMLPFICCWLVNSFLTHGHPSLSFPLPSSARVPSDLFSRSHQIISCPAEMLSLSPTGNVFRQWQEYGIFPSPPSLPATFLRNLPALKAADRPERCRP